MRAPQTCVPFYIAPPSRCLVPLPSVTVLPPSFTLKSRRDSGDCVVLAPRITGSNRRDGRTKGMGTCRRAMYRREVVKMVPIIEGEGAQRRAGTPCPPQPPPPPQIPTLVLSY